MKTTGKKLLSAAILASGLFSNAALLAAPLKVITEGSASEAENISEMVTLVADFSGTYGEVYCPILAASGFGSWFWSHLKINPDATRSEFSIPTGYTLVITGVDSQSGLGIESSISGEVLITGGASNTALRDVAIHPGVKICADGGGNIHGHLEKNK